MPTTIQHRVEQAEARAARLEEEHAKQAYETLRPEFHAAFEALADADLLTVLRWGSGEDEPGGEIWQGIAARVLAEVEARNEQDESIRQAIVCLRRELET